MKIKEFVNNLPHKKVYLGIGVFVFLLLITFIINKTHAFYNSESDTIPLVNAKVGDFASKKNLVEFCEGYDTLGECITAKKDIITKLENVSEPIEGDTLARYQGDATIVNNNYICFGTTNKEECTSDTEKYMYRIIGIVTQNGDNETEKIGQLKVIKKEALDTPYRWHYTSGASWAVSELYGKLNGTYFLTNTELYPYMSTYMNNRIWTGRIVNHEWRYGDIDYSSTGANQSGAGVLAKENTWTEYTIPTTENPSKVGLMYLSDYYLAYDSVTNWYITSWCSDCGANNWLYTANVNSSSDEWTMSRTPGGYAFRVDPEGRSRDGGATFPYYVRPVFYIENTMQIACGSGTIEDPYMFVNPYNPPEVPEHSFSDVCSSYSNIGECVQKGNLDKIPNLESTANMEERSDNLRRFQGHGEDITSNYICFGANTKEECKFVASENAGEEEIAKVEDNNDKYAYRIIGVVSENDTTTGEKIGMLKIIKKEALNTTYKWHSEARIGVKRYRWNDVMLYKQLNGIDTGDSSYPNDIFLTSTIYVPNTSVGSKNWSDIIADIKWRYGGISSSEATSGTAVLEKEKAWSDLTDPTKIGLMYLSDYYLAYDNTTNWSSRRDTSNWLLLQNNDKDIYNGGSLKTEWTMTDATQKNAWIIDGLGYTPRSNAYTYHFGVRPVFYLTSTIQLEGTGLERDPYIIKNV